MDVPPITKIFENRSCLVSAGHFSIDFTQSSYMLNISIPRILDGENKSSVEIDLSLSNCNLSPVGS
jgi:hypothetical protein